MQGRIVHDDGAQRVAVFGPVLLVLIRGTITVDGVLQATAIGRELGEKFPGRVGAITIVEPGIPMPSSEARNISAQSTKESDRWVCASATILLGEGFWMSTARSVYTGILLLARGNKPRKVFEDVGTGTRWLGDQLSFDPARKAALTSFAQSSRLP